MKRMILSGILALAAGASGLWAQPRPKSQKEVEALQAMFNAQDPDTRIKAAEDLLTKFADTEFKGIALFFEAASYEQKGDYDKVVIYGERALEADPKNYQAMLMLARNIAAHTRENDLDREEKLAKVEKYSKNAMDTLKDAAKPNPQLTDDQWNGAKKDFTAQAHEALGLAAMARKKYDVAANEFQFAVDNSTTPDPATMVRLGAAENLAGKHDEAVAVLDKVMAMPNLNPAIRQFAQAERVRALQAKGGAKPAAPPAPPQVDIKKP
ncbi:MAG TPA: tetratricopeptide repeat protein [Bryobacteraceae bacterium]|nr:tetratricopeptide repeat protein [Bryobacteraceae bacterium]